MKNNEKTPKRKSIVIILISIIGLGILFLVAHGRNTLLAFFIGFPLLVFFSIVFLVYSILAIARKDLKSYLSIILIGVIGIPATFYLIRYTDHDLRALNEQRRQVFNELRPIFLKYKKENNAYPKKLNDLIPKYIKKIPPMLVYDGNAKPGMKISYSGNEKDAVFWYHTHRGPDSSEFYSIAHDRYQHQE